MAASINTAVILAAGMGTRLQQRGTLYPKGFLRVGERPIIEESIVYLKSVGIFQIILVTGHLSDFYRRLRDNYRDLVETVHNPRYAESGSMYSLHCARERLQRDFLLLESDLVYEHRALSACLDFPQDNVVLLSGPTHSGDEVYVEGRNGKLTGVSKDPAALGPDVVGELVGISKISMPLFQVMLEEAGTFFRQSLDMHYDTHCLERAARRYPVYCHRIDDLAWSEIDDEEHFDRARDKVYPRILERDGNRR